MSDTDLDAAVAKRLYAEEGLRRFPYKDTVGKLTIGVGHNLTDNGLPEPIIEALLSYDIAQAKAALDLNLPWWRGLDTVRAAALVDLCFNMGIGSLLSFKDVTLKMIQGGDWTNAAAHLRASLWYRQVGPTRGESIARAIELGEE